MMTMHAPGVSVTLPRVSALPIVVDSPHSGTHYPADFQPALQGLAVRQGEDTWVHELYASAPDHGATLIAAEFPRAYIDPNRSLDDIDTQLLDAPWPGPVVPSRKTALGVGLVWRLMAGQPLYARTLSVAEVQSRIDNCWKPYHAALDAALAEAARWPERWHLNVHSMPDDSYRRMGLPEKPLADFVLGNLDGTTADEATMAVVERSLLDSGFSVARNDPFKGVEIIRTSGQPARGWHALQIEVRRPLYMDDALNKHEGFARLRDAVDAMLQALTRHVRGRLQA
jgi:N-formylglutamate deformylase